MDVVQIVPSAWVGNCRLRRGVRWRDARSTGADFPRSWRCPDTFIAKPGLSPLDGDLMKCHVRSFARRGGASHQIFGSTDYCAHMLGTSSGLQTP